MKELAVVYATKYGHTKQYAEWVKEETGADIFVSTSFSPTRALEYKAVVFAGGVYGDKIMIMDWLKKNLGQVNVNKMIIAAVSWYCNDSEEAKARLIEENYPEQFKNVVPLIVINSGIDKKKISVVDKAQLLAAQTSINKHEVRSSDDINALAIIKGYADSTSKDNLKSLLAAVQNILNPPKKSAQRAAEEIRAALNEPKKPAEAPKPAPSAAPETPKPAAPSGEHVVTSLDDALAALSSGNMLLNKPPVHQPKPVEPVVEETVEVEEPVQPVEEPKAEIPAPVQPKPEPPKTVTQDGEPIVTSLDDALAALSSGNMLLNHPPVHQNHAAEAPKAETSTFESPKKEETIKASSISMDEPEQPVITEEPKADIPTPVVEKKPIEEASEPVREEFKEEPKIEVPAPSETIIENKNDNILSMDDIEKLTSSAPAPAPAPTPAPTPAPAPAPKPVPRPAPVPKPVETAPKRNSYMDLFSRKKPAEEPAAPFQPTASAPTPAPAPTVDVMFDPLAASAPAPAPAPAPKPAPAPVSSAGMDFDFDILGNESSTASKTSSRALNAVEDLAKAKAKAEAERLKSERAREEQAARDAAAAKADNSYDIINNSIDLDITDDGVPKQDNSSVYSSVSENKNIGSISMDEDDDDDIVVEETAENTNAYETVDNTFGDDVMFVDDYDDSELDGITAEALLAPEQPAQQSEHKRVDFKKLQQEIEESIELNRQIREKERTRNMRESERKALAEAEKTPKKGIKQPEDADIFFKRPGKDYYSSDSMPEIKFNRHGNGF
ncbi:MAG: flavodoxin domain-containing protein [Oscillospiraceae bacterium]